MTCFRATHSSSSLHGEYCGLVFIRVMNMSGLGAATPRAGPPPAQLSHARTHACAAHRSTDHGRLQIPPKCNSNPFPLIIHPDPSPLLLNQPRGRNRFINRVLLGLMGPPAVQLRVCARVCLCVCVLCSITVVKETYSRSSGSKIATL